jgi:hypothetical protein
MNLSVDTFNLNNLFSRWNFKVEIDAIKKNETGVSDKIKYEFDDDTTYRLRTYKGRLVKKKDDDDRQKIADRIKSMNLDVLAGCSPPGPTRYPGVLSRPPGGRSL